MCRMVAYLGEPLRLRELVERPEHSLYHQSYAHREMPNVAVNADGWGAAWYLEGEYEPCVYRSTLPIWADLNASLICRAAQSGCLIAAVRSATDPLSAALVNTQPFEHGAVAFLHNGFVRDFKQRIMRRVRAELSDVSYSRIHGDTDSEHLFALLLDQYSRARNLRDAVSAAIAQISKLAREASTACLATVVVTDGSELVAGRFSYGAPAPSLYQLVEDQSVFIASEPLDGRAWQACTEGELLSFGRPRGTR